MWVQLIVSFVMMVVSSALTAASMQKPKDPEAGELDVPTADEGGNVPVIFGTVIVKNSNVVWYGDARTTPIMSSGGGKK